MRRAMPSRPGNVMHVKYVDRLTWLVVASGFVFLGILLLSSFGDYFSRDWLGNGGT